MDSIRLADGIYPGRVIECGTSELLSERLNSSVTFVAGTTTSRTSGYARIVLVALE